MQRYGGTLIHRGRDAHGDLEVVQNGDERTLHFGTAAKQSALLLSDPGRLALSYTRAMTCALLFGDPPRRALMVGLGGGSLARFLLHHVPHCHIDAVELREQVVQVAHDWFLLPQDERLCITVADGYRFVTNRPADAARYDIALVDAFVARGLAPEVAAPVFLEALLQSLTRDGCMAMNLWAQDHYTLTAIIETIADTFGRRPLVLPLAGKDNLVVLAAREPPRLRSHLRRLGERARHLETVYGIEYPAFLRHLRKANGWRL